MKSMKNMKHKDWDTAYVPCKLIGWCQTYHASTLKHSDRGYHWLTTAGRWRLTPTVHLATTTLVRLTLFVYAAPLTPSTSSSSKAPIHGGVTPNCWHV